MTTLSFEGPGDNRPRIFGPEKEAQKSSIVIVVDSFERAPDGILALEGTAQGALQEAYATLEDRAPVGGFPNVDQVVGEAPSEVTADLAFLARLVMAGPRRMRMPGRIMLSSYVQPME